MTDYSELTTRLLTAARGMEAEGYPSTARLLEEAADAMRQMQAERAELRQTADHAILSRDRELRELRAKLAELAEAWDHMKRPAGPKSAAAYARMESLVKDITKDVRR